MHQHGKKKILVVVDDLLFTVKISDAAKRAGLEAEFVRSEKDVIDKATNEKPLLIILDLNNNSVQPLELISKLKGDGDLRHISLIGYLSHVQGELKQKAQEAGAITIFFEVELLDVQLERLLLESITYKGIATGS